MPSAIRRCRTSRSRCLSNGLCCLLAVCLLGGSLYRGPGLQPAACRGRPCSRPSAPERTGCAEGESVFDKYCVVTLFFTNQSSSGGGAATLCTQSTVELVWPHVRVQCERWGGPLSLALYAPAEDFPEALRLASAMRACSPCVREKVRWHAFFEADRAPPPLRPGQGDPWPGGCDLDRVAPLRRRSQGLYPINVGRNVARMKTDTPFVLSVDVELYPSLDVLPRFERMIRAWPVRRGGGEVWVLPVFEVYAQYEAPLNKGALRSMYMARRAVSFHRYRCNACHRIPNVTRWLNHRAQSGEALGVWSTVQRNKRWRLQSWEPFFFGTNKDPWYDVRLSWEGKQNKMQMAYEMCLLNYNYHILDEAFLVHAPGVSVMNATLERERSRRHSNARLMRSIRQQLRRKHGLTKGC